MGLASTRTISSPLGGLEMQSRYRWHLYHLGIEAVTSKLCGDLVSFTLAHCLVGSNVPGRPRGKLWERSLSEAPVVCRLTPGSVDNPVIFPPGRASWRRTRCQPDRYLVITMGIVLVASLTARVVAGTTRDDDVYLQTH